MSPLKKTLITLQRNKILFVPTLVLYTVIVTISLIISSFVNLESLHYFRGGPIAPIPYLIGYAFFILLPVLALFSYNWAGTYGMIRNLIEGQRVTGKDYFKAGQYDFQRIIGTTFLLGVPAFVIFTFVFGVVISYRIHRFLFVFMTTGGFLLFAIVLLYSMAGVGIKRWTVGESVKRSLRRISTKGFISLLFLFFGVNLILFCSSYVLDLIPLIGVVLNALLHVFIIVLHMVWFLFIVKADSEQAGE